MVTGVKEDMTAPTPPRANLLSQLIRACVTLPSSLSKRPDTLERKIRFLTSRLRNLSGVKMMSSLIADVSLAAAAPGLTHPDAMRLLPRYIAHGRRCPRSTALRHTWRAHGRGSRAASAAAAAAGSRAPRRCGAASQKAAPATPQDLRWRAPR